MFVASGVEAPVRDIATAAGVGMGTIYRHFPTRADLVIAVYRHQVDACAEAGPARRARGVVRWVHDLVPLGRVVASWLTGTWFR